jgi:phosphoribosylamine--glycine ligase
MKILIIGNGGRESAFAWKLAQEENVTDVIVCPGNDGMKQMSNKIRLVTNNSSIEEYLNIAKDMSIDLTFVGPEGPLVAGIVDLFEGEGLAIVGPNKYCAQLEGSKIFSKDFMKKWDIPTARFIVAHSYEKACDVIDNWPFSSNGFVIKADGLAGGKGVVVTANPDEAKQSLHDFMVDPDISVKSPEILLEEVLVGREASYFALCDGVSYQVLGMACDHKRLLDNDKGPNTGGMGCYHSKNWPSEDISLKIQNRVLEKTLHGMKENGTPYKGILFIGVMIDDKNDPYVVEYNVRFGDPEAQTLVPLFNGSLSLSLLDAARNNLSKTTKPITLNDNESVHVVMTSRGYPTIGKGNMDLGHEITNDLLNDDCFLFYAGVKKVNNVLVNSGGRVLGVTTIASKVKVACQLTYKEINKIKFTGSFYRKDIGAKYND